MIVATIPTMNRVLRDTPRSFRWPPCRPPGAVGWRIVCQPTQKKRRRWQCRRKHVVESELGTQSHCRIALNEPSLAGVSALPNGRCVHESALVPERVDAAFELQRRLEADIALEHVAVVS